MSEREKGASATWRAVRTLEWKKKQEAGEAGPKEFGDILCDAQNVMVASWTSSGNRVPNYPPRLSEIQVQDEAYILQQLLKPEEVVKPKRGLLRGHSRNKSRGVRLLRSNASRKVRFNDDGHGRPSATGFPKPTRSSGTGNEQKIQCCKASSASATSEAVDSRRSSQVDNQPTSNKITMKVAVDRSTPASKEASAAIKATPQQDDTAAASSLNSACDMVVALANDRCTSTDEGPTAAAFVGRSIGSNSPIIGVRVAAQTSTADQAVAKGQPLPGQLMLPGYCSGDGGIMARFLQLQPSKPAAPLMAQYSDSRSSAKADPSTTQLADKQLDHLRNSTAPPPPKPEEPHPLGYRPLLIPDQLFQKWNSLAAAGKVATSPSTRSKVVGGSMPASTQQHAGEADRDGSGSPTELMSSVRRSTANTLPSATPADTKLPSCSVVCMNSAGDAAASENNTSTHIVAAAANISRRGRQRHTVDCVGDLSTIDLASRSSIRASSSNLLASPSMASAECCSPKSHGSCSSNGGQSTHCLSSPGYFTTADVRQHGSSISLLDLADAEQIHRAADPLRPIRRAAVAGSAVTGVAGPGKGGPGRSSALKGSRMESADSTGLPTTSFSSGTPSRAASEDNLSGSVHPLLRLSGGATWQGAGVGNRTEDNSNSRSSGCLQGHQGLNQDKQKTSAKRLQLPAIVKAPARAQALRSSRN